MSNETIQLNSTERLYGTVFNSSNVLVAGLTDVLVEIKRVSDGYYLDFNDNTFKNTGWTTREQQMSELDASNSIGVYYYDFDTTGFSEDKYFIRVDSVSAVNMPAEGELKVGGYIDDIDAPISGRAPASEYDAELTTLLADVATALADVLILKKVETNRWNITGNQMIIYDTDAVTPLFTFDLKDSAGAPTETNPTERTPV
jgi:hypothetical protein